MKVILCPTDFSECANNASKYACRMAKIMNAEVILLHAMLVPVIDAYTPPSTMTSMMDDLRVSSENRTANLAEELAKEFAIKVTTMVQFGLPHDLIRTIEKEQELELIVMGTKGANNAIDVILGTNASQVMRNALTPTMIIPEDAQFGGLKNVGYATDFTNETDNQIDTFNRLLEPFRSEVTVVHVAKNTSNSDQIDRMIQHLNHPTKPETIKGEHIAEELHAFVWENNLALLALKRHKRNWFENLFHRSVTKEMALSSKVPILIFS